MSRLRLGYIYCFKHSDNTDGTATEQSENDVKTATVQQEELKKDKKREKERVWS